MWGWAAAIPPLGGFGTGRIAEGETGLPVFACEPRRLYPVNCSVVCVGGRERP